MPTDWCAETVDVIIPVRNRPRLIEICLNSVKAQTLQPNSVIAVDDGSTDSTPAVLAEYAHRWSKLRVLRSNHLGTAHARNIGLAASGAGFVAFLDSDDIWLPEKLERQMPLFAARPNVGLVHCAFFQINDEGETLHDGRVFAPSKRGDIFHEMINTFYHLSGSASGVVARRDLVMRVGGFDERLLHVEDQDLWIKLARVSLVDFTPEPLVAVRVHRENRFSGRAKSDPAIALLQKIAVWSKWIDLANKEAVVENLRRDAFVINQASPLRLYFHFRAYRKLKTSFLPLARHLFPTFASYLRRLVHVRVVRKLNAVRSWLIEQLFTEPVSGWRLTRSALKRFSWQPRDNLTAPFRRFSQRQTCSYQPHPTRILLLAANLARGGTQRDMLNVANGLVQRGYDVRIITFDASEPEVPTFEKEWCELGIVPQTLMDFAVGPKGSGERRSKLSNFSREGAWLPQWFSDLVCGVARGIESHQPSIVHAWNDKVGLISALAAVSLGVPRIVVSFGSLPLTYHNVKFSPLLKPGYAALARNPDVILLNNSSAGAASYERWIGLRRGTIRTVPNAFLRRYHRRPREDEVKSFRATLNATMEQPVVGAVMRLSQEKDPALWLATAAAISKAQPDALFVICGYGPAKEEVERQIHDLGLTGRMRLVEPISDLGLVYAAFDVVLLTSLVEGLPNMLIEAQAAGCPVVTTDVGGAREAISEGLTGILVKRRSAQELANAVLVILHDSSWRQRARTHGRLFVARNFGLERVMDDMAEVYKTRMDRLCLGATITT